MTNIIKIDKKQISQFAVEAGKFVFKPEAEYSLEKLLDTIDFLNDELAKVKEAIASAGLSLSPDFKGVIGERLTATFRNYGDRYQFDGKIADPKFVKKISFDKPNIVEVDEYLKKHKKLPKGIKFSDRSPVISISRKNGTITP